MTQTADKFIADLYNSIDWRAYRNRFNVKLFRAYFEKDKRLSEGATEQDIDSFFNEYIKGIEEFANGYVAKVLDTADKIDRKIHPRPRLAILPTGDLNAWAIPLGNGESICILDFSLMGCLNALSAGIAYGILAYQKVSEEDRIESVKHLVLIEALLFLGLRNRLESSTYNEYIYKVPELFRNDYIQHLSTGLTFNLLFFIIAHEVAHHALGHLSQTSTVTIGSRSLGVHVFTRSQEQEFEADLLGCQMLLAFLDESKKHAQNATALAFAPLLFFHFLFVVNEVKEKFTGASAGSVTHPPAAERRMRLTRYLEAQSISDWKEFYARVEEIFSCIRGADVRNLIQ